MGTNYYAIHIPTEEEYNKMQEALTKRQLDKLQNLIKKSTIKYHIGKRSYGWAFLFQGRDESELYYESSEANVPWDDNLISLKKYLCRKDIKIQDEYGDVFTPEQFWKEEVGESLYVHKDFNSIETYYQSHPEERKENETFEEVKKDKTRWSYRWFC